MILQCPECKRVSSVPEWISRPICVHSWESNTPEIWDGDHIGDEDRLIEQSPNFEFRYPGPNTWSEMVEIEIKRNNRLKRIWQWLKE